jgi:hypothetical protein
MGECATQPNADCQKGQRYFTNNQTTSVDITSIPARNDTERTGTRRHERCGLTRTQSILHCTEACAAKIGMPSPSIILLTIFKLLNNTPVITKRKSTQGKSK